MHVVDGVTDSQALMNTTRFLSYHLTAKLRLLFINTGSFDQKIDSVVLSTLLHMKIIFSLNFQLKAMLKRVVHSLGLLETDENPKRKNRVRGTKTSSSPDFVLTCKDSVVRIILQGGQQEVYQHAVLVSKLMAKYPGMFVALPQVFKAPHQSLLLPEERLLLGHKYVMISSTDFEKLKRKHPQQDKTKENDKLSVPNEVTGQEIVDTNESKIPESYEEKVNAKMNLSQGGENVEESYYFAKDFYVPKCKSTRYCRRKGINRKTICATFSKGKIM